MKETCLYDLWKAGEIELQHTPFTLAMFAAFELAGGINRIKLVESFPHLFSGSQFIKGVKID